MWTAREGHVSAAEAILKGRLLEPVCRQPPRPGDSFIFPRGESKLHVTESTIDRAPVPKWETSSPARSHALLFQLEEDSEDDQVTYEYWIDECEQHRGHFQQYHTLHYNTPLYNTPRYNIPRCNAPRYNAPRYNAPRYNAPRYDTPRVDENQWCVIL